MSQSNPKISKISGIAVVFLVQSLERTRRFYADALGLELELKEDYLLGTLPSGTELVFFVGEAVRGTSPQIVFGLDEGGIDTAAEALAERGVQVLTPVTEAPGGWSVELADPDGHRWRSTRRKRCRAVASVCASEGVTRDGAAASRSRHQGASAASSAGAPRRNTSPVAGPASMPEARVSCSGYEPAWAKVWTRRGQAPVLLSHPQHTE